MDNALLEAIVTELRAKLLGWPLFRVAPAGDDALVLLFDDPARSRLLVSAAPALARLHLTREKRLRRELEPTTFGSSAHHQLAGAILVAIDKEPADRTVRLRFAGPSGPGKSLVAELFGRSSNLLVLDSEDRILAFMRRLKSEFRRPIAGEPYSPPRAAPGTDAGADSGRAAPGNSSEDPSMAGSSPSVDASALRSIGPVPPRVPVDPLRHKGRGFIYAERPPEELDPRQAPAPDRFVLSAMPLSSAAQDLVRFDYPSLNEAADRYYEALAAGVALRSRRDALLAIARREARRAGEIAAKVGGDLEGMKAAARYKLFGEALLAGLTQAVRTGGTVLVPDPYDAEGAVLAVPIDPAATLPANAERYFQKHRKAERGRVIAQRRREEQSARCSAMIVLSEAIAGAAKGADLDDAEAELRGHGVAVGLKRRHSRAPAQADPVAEGVRLYRSSEGYEILVGKGSEENDRLTFKLASAEDFWLHASGSAGAHVVVRNPRVETRLRKTLEEAAQLAAFFSKAKGAGRTEVMITRRKYVRRIRGGARGTVTVKKHESVNVVPRNPFEGT